jgi:hypothetical protein
VELAVGRQHAHRPPRREQRQQPQDEAVRVRPESDRRRVRQVEEPGDMALGARDHLAEDRLPLAVGEPGGVLPAPFLRREGHVRPEVMAMGRHMQPPRIGGEEAGEVPLVAHRGPAAV